MTSGLHMCNRISEACCLTNDWLETQVAAQQESLLCIDLALRSSVGKRLVGVIHEFTIDPDALRRTTLSRYGESSSRSLATVHKDLCDGIRYWNVACSVGAHAALNTAALSTYS